MKKKLILMCVAGVLAMTAVIGGTLAGFNTTTDNKAVTDISLKALGIELEGTSEQIGQDEVAVDAPGGMVELKHSITNNMEEGYTLYTRVTIDKKWDSVKNVVLDPAKIHLYVVNGEDKTELIEGTTVNDWIVWYSDDEQVIMYYTKPMQQGEESLDFIDAVGFDVDMDNTYTDAQVKLDFMADAVQTIAAKNSMPSEWGVYPTIDESTGTIISIEE